MKKLDTKKRTIIALTLIMILIIGISLVLINNNTNKNDLVLNNPNKKQISRFSAKMSQPRLCLGWLGIVCVV